MSKWIHLVATWDGQTGRFYKNGKKVGYGGKKPELLTDGLVLGKGRTEQDYYNGLMDDVRIYSRALTPEEVATHFNESKADKGVK